MYDSGGECSGLGVQMERLRILASPAALPSVLEQLISA